MTDNQPPPPETTPAPEPPAVEERKEEFTPVEQPGDNGKTLAEELERVQYELRQQVLQRAKRTDDNGLFNLDVSSLVTFDQTHEVEDGPPINKIKTWMRCCYSNEVKSAKELKIFLKGEIPMYFPVVSFNTNPMMNPS